MTDNDIIKALECCITKDSMGDKCEECPCANGCPGYDITHLLEYALDLINRQKAEIERLTEERKKASAYIGNGWGYVSFLEFVKNARAEAITEFAERLCEGRVSNDPVVIAVKTELKMMKGEQE